MKKKVTGKLKLHKETLLNLQHVVGGQAAAAVDSEGPIKCLISDCTPCNHQVAPGDVTLPAHPPAEAAPLQPGEVAISPRP